MNQILIGINKNLLFGMGEELRLRDILFPYESKIIDPEKEKNLFYSLTISAKTNPPESTAKTSILFILNI